MTSPIQNYFSPLEFRISVFRLPNTTFFTQQTAIPGISTSPVSVPNQFNPIFQTPDHVDYSNLDLTFIIDEDMNNYMEIFNWIIGTAFPENHSQYRNLKETEDSLFSDISIIVMNSKKNANITFNFRNCFPISLSDITLNTTESDLNYPQCTATFKYDYFDVKH